MLDLWLLVQNLEIYLQVKDAEMVFVLIIIEAIPLSITLCLIGLEDYAGMLISDEKREDERDDV